jgi:hypothetical protein
LESPSKLGPAPPAAKLKKTPGKNGFVYKPQYGLIIVCESEAQQREFYGCLLGQGYKLKVVTV